VAQAVPPAPPAGAGSRVRPGMVVLLVAGTLLALLGLALVVAGAAVAWFAANDRDDDGFFTSSTFELASDGYALRSEELDFGADPDGWEPFGDVDGLATLRLTARRVDGAGEVFLGIARSDDVADYLDGVAHTLVDDIDDDPFEPEYRHRRGGPPPGPPGDQPFWLASAAGPGEQTLEWELESGRFAAVLMNADGSRPVAADVSAGVKISFLVPLLVALLVGGSVLLLIGVVMIAVGAARLHRPGAGPGQGAPPPGAAPVAAAAPISPSPEPGPPPSAYPVRLEGRLDEPLNRGLWVVKWILAIPHYIVLFFLWIAFAVLTFVAGVAILFTGRYPRGIFDFNVGVLRWTWRVGFYSYSALATDRYPPFSLHPEDYPATLDIPYPERLNRWLVLVKWWLLAIPHYLVVSVLGGGWGFGTWWWRSGWADNVDDNPVGWGIRWGGGLVGLLLVVAVVVLLCTGRYPRGVFDIVMGASRWAYRVWAYAALLRDEYPPFRLDLGPTEPAPPPPSAPASWPPPPG